MVIRVCQKVSRYTIYMYVYTVTGIHTYIVYANSVNG